MTNGTMAAHPLTWSRLYGDECRQKVHLNLSNCSVGPVLDALFFM
jgi:hypothetical protein